MARSDTNLHVKPKQSLGQNFLVDENIVRKIARAFHPSENDVVLEIGPGQGALTAELAGKVRHLILVEIDGRVIDHLRERFGSQHTTIIHSDILDVDFAELHRTFGEKLRVIGNLPYHLTSGILFMAFENASAIRDLTVMVQREVAERISAAAGGKKYGILSVMTQYYGTAKLLFDVSPNCFYPKPKVVSSVLNVRLHDIPPNRAANGEEFRLLVRTVFGKRRKTLRNSLKYLPYDESTIERILGESPISLDKRPEQLPLEEFLSLTHHIHTCIS